MVEAFPSDRPEQSFRKQFCQGETVLRWLFGAIRGRPPGERDFHSQLPAALAAESTHGGLETFAETSIHRGVGDPNRSIDEDSLHFGLLGRCSDEGNIGKAPNLVIDVLSIRCNQVAGYNIFAFCLAHDLASA